MSCEETETRLSSARVAASAGGVEGLDDTLVFTGDWGRLPAELLRETADCCWELRRERLPLEARESLVPVGRSTGSRLRPRAGCFSDWLWA